MAEQNESQSRELAQTLGEEVTPEISRFVGTVLGSPSFELGELVAGEVRLWRFRRNLRHVRKAEQLLDEAGMNPKQVPLRTLAPMLESGSLEDDEELSDRWAALLANAAAEETPDVPASFPAVLRELEPAQAILLDQLYVTTMKLAPELRNRRHGLDGLGAARDAGIPEDDYGYHADNLVRQGLAESPANQSSPLLVLTDFGQRFVRSCWPPNRPDPPVVYETPEQVAEVVRQTRERRAKENQAEVERQQGQADTEQEHEQ